MSKVCRFSRQLLTPALAALLVLMGGPVSAAQPGLEADTRAYNIAHGRVVFTRHCLRCHGEENGNAPMPDSAADWQGRLDQPLQELIRHAINGHGDMPARGETNLVDQEIAAAVAFVVHRARLVAAEQMQGATPGDTRIASAAKDTRPSSADAVDDAVLRMFLLLMGKERW